MNIKLLELNLKNFKGLKDFKLKAHGKDIEIRGDNGSGKTTLYDAFLWLLFDKDSEGKKDFEIKTLDKDNNVIHKLEHEVEGTLDIDGMKIVLKKVYKENWVKKRGTVEPVLQGHVTDYWIDDVPTKKKEYDTYINSLVDETEFKLLTDVRYFTEKITWQERRKILTELADKYMKEVKLPENLSKLIGNRIVDDYKKIIVEKRKKLKKELESIPIRIDELHNNLPDIEGIDFGQLETEVKNYKEQINEIDNQSKQILEHNNKLFEMKMQARQKQAILDELQEQMERESNKDYYRAENDKRDFSTNLEIENNKLELLNSKQENLSEEKVRKEKLINDLRQEWIDEKKKTYTGDATCPTCKQALPDAEIKKVKQTFETNKQSTLNDINAKGKRIGEELKELEEDIKQTEKNIDSLSINIADLEDKLNRVEKILAFGKEQEIDYSKNDEWKATNEELLKLTDDIATFKEMDSSTLEIKKNGLMREIESRNDILGKQVQIKQAESREKELLAQEKELATNINNLDKQEFALKEYSDKKVELLETTVNKMFKTIKFKMFEIQLNGGEKEICEILIDGIPYASANYAGRINAGLDVINTLSKEYGIYAPVFIDNSESVTELMQLEQQMIKLIVDSNYNKLKIIEKETINE